MMPRPLLRRFQSEVDGDFEPQRWRAFSVSVCIAIIAGHEEQLVLVSDSKVTFGDFSADKVADKNITLLADWAVLFAGDDVGSAGPICRRTQQRCLRDSVFSDADRIAQILHEEMKEELARTIEAKVLSRYRLTLGEFKAKGKKVFTDAVYFEVSSKIDRVSLPLKFMLCGFDSKGVGHIRYITAAEPPKDVDQIGFFAIGSGADSALSSLCHSADYLHMSRHSELAEAAYHALAAKFMSESDPKVGKHTFLVALQKGKVAKFMTALYGIEHIRSQWEKFGAPKAPKKLIAATADLLMPFRESLTAEGIAKAVKRSPRKLSRLKGMSILPSPQKPKGDSGG
jgi:ATP-dependent protease HslVU (ClpYQ) peptidase subunit